MSKTEIINDNNNFAPSIFRSLCEFEVFLGGSVPPE